MCVESDWTGDSDTRLMSKTGQPSSCEAYDEGICKTTGQACDSCDSYIRDWNRALDQFLLERG